MKSARILRMIIAALFLAATVAFFLTADFRDRDSIAMLRIHDNLEFTEQAQIIPSSIAACMGALLFWLCITFFIGRVYCSTVCPIGTLSDLGMRLRKELGRIFPSKLKLEFRYKPACRWRYHIMAAYFICLVIGIMAVPFVLEPWNIVRNIATLTDPDAVASTWLLLGCGMVVGLVFGAISTALVLVWGFFAGRDYCNIICPVGQALSLVDRFALLHIEFDPDKCISCMKCEDVCRASCIQVSRRIVDNSRCVMCLDCISSCPSNAIRLQSTRNRAATPDAVGS